MNDSQVIIITVNTLSLELVDVVKLTIAKDVVYTLFAIAIVATLGRLYIRWVRSALNWDDLFNGLALVCLIAYQGVTCSSSPTNCVVDSSTPAGLEIQLAEAMILWTVLYSVKASFLALSWQVFNLLPGFRKAWWSVSIYTFATFWPIFLSKLWQCGNPSGYNNPATCPPWFSEGTSSSAATAAMAASLHASSELLIMALPLAFLARSNLPTAQKLSAASVFALALIIIAMGLMRNFGVMCAALGFNVDGSLDLQYVMAEMEPPLTVIVCTMPAYSVLLARLPKRRRASATLAELQKGAAPMGATTPRRKKSAQTFEPLDSTTELEMA